MHRTFHFVSSFSALATVGAGLEGDLMAIAEDEERIVERDEKRKQPHEDGDMGGSIADGLSKREVQLLSKLEMRSI